MSAPRAAPAAGALLSAALLLLELHVGAPHEQLADREQRGGPQRAVGVAIEEILQLRDRRVRRDGRRAARPARPPGGGAGDDAVARARRAGGARDRLLGAERRRGDGERDRETEKLHANHCLGLLVVATGAERAAGVPVIPLASPVVPVGALGVRP